MTMPSTATRRRSPGRSRRSCGMSHQTRSSNRSHPRSRHNRRGASRQGRSSATRGGPVGITSRSATGRGQTSRSCRRCGLPANPLRSTAIGDCLSILSFDTV
jgi:hypothetical protein